MSLRIPFSLGSLLFFLWAGQVSVQAKDTVIKEGRWRLTYQEDSQSFHLAHCLKGNAEQLIFQDSRPTASYCMQGEKSQTVSSASYTQMQCAKSPLVDAFGKGVSYSFTFSRPKKSGAPDLVQQFCFYPEADYVLTTLSLSALSEVASNYLAPVCVNQCFQLFPAADENRMLKVPFDNDDFVRYHKYHLNTEMLSYEVAAFYQGKGGQGIVMGSVEHNSWKSGVEAKAKGDSRLKCLRLYSGVSSKESRDVLPHGRVRGTTVSSARMFIGHFADWRTGMETYAKANTTLQPMRTNWTKGTPFGWQSWGVMAQKNSFDVDRDVAEYFATTLQPGSFQNDRGNVVISIDAWDNLSHEQKLALTAFCHARGQLVGTYFTPFCIWWDEKGLHRSNLDETDYLAWDCALKMNGKAYMYDGAFCLDPTHPGTKQRIQKVFSRLKAEGFDYVKIDFTSNAIIQADAYSNPQVTTAVEAYNEGFTYLLEEADKGTPLFIALSIAPIFPYQYGNSRRIACDTWGKINQTEYSMNAISGGWWTNLLYQYNDPDHLVLVGNDSVKETLGENRARVTNGVVAGMVLVADNYSATDKSGRGDAKLSFERARQVLMNRDINEIGALGRSFRPVYGYKEYDGKDHQAENLFYLHTDKYLYVAVFNYTDKPLSGTLPLEDVAIKASSIKEVKELWSDSPVTLSHRSLSYAVPGKDAQVYRFLKK